MCISIYLYTMKSFRCEWVLYTCLPSIAFCHSKKITCALVTLASIVQILVLFTWWLILCAIFSVPYMNRTFITHTLPNTVDFTLYVLSGKPTDNIPPPTRHLYKPNTFCTFRIVFGSYQSHGPFQAGVRAP